MNNTEQFCSDTSLVYICLFLAETVQAICPLGLGFSSEFGVISVSLPSALRLSIPQVGKKSFSQTLFSLFGLGLFWFFVITAQ